MIRKILVRQFIIILAAACSLIMLKGSHKPAYAETQSIVIEIPVYGQAVSSNLTAEAESLVSSAISNQFEQSPALETVQVVVVIHRNGEVIPFLATMVSRAQWQESSQVQAWTRYYGLASALLQRHEQEAIIATAPPSSSLAAPAPAAPRVTSNLENFPQTQIERALEIDDAFDSGSLTGQPAQEFLSDLD
jgi:hypothetical protein